MKKTLLLLCSAVILFSCRRSLDCCGIPEVNCSCHTDTTYGGFGFSGVYDTSKKQMYQDSCNAYRTANKWDTCTVEYQGL